MDKLEAIAVPLDIRRSCGLRLIMIISLSEVHHIGNVATMNTIVQVNPRGTLTLPKVVRQALGMSPSGGIVMLNMRENDVLLQATAAFPIEMYTEARGRR